MIVLTFNLWVDRLLKIRLFILFISKQIGSSKLIHKCRLFIGQKFIPLKINL